MNKNKGLLTSGIILSLVCVFMTSSFATTPVLTPDDIRAAGQITSNRARVPEVILPKTNDFSGEDELPIPEGVKPIQGLNIPLQMKEIKVYGLDHKPYGVDFLRNAISKATKFHNDLDGAPALKNNFKIQRKGKFYTIQVNAQSYLAFVYALAQEITNKYQADQFLLARAIVPEQTINQAGSSVEICVAEGYLASEPVLVMPEGTKNSEKLKQRFAPHLNHLKNLRPLDFTKLERALLLVRDMPGAEIKTTFKQAPENTNTKQIKTDSICERALNNGAGSTSLEVRLDVDQFDGQISVDNFGTSALGPEIVRFQIGANSQIKAGDRYALSVSKAIDSNETLNFTFNGQVPIGVNGLKAKLFYSNGDAEPGGFIDGLNVTNGSQVAGISLEYPYIRSRKKNLTFEAGIRSQQTETDSAAGELEDSDLTTLRLRSTYDFSDKNNAVNLITAELVAGIDGSFSNGAISDDSNQLDENFILIRGELSRFQAIALNEKATGSLTWVNSLSWQYTDEPLFSSEEFALGGREYGRGFDLAIITGDQAIALKTELQYDNKFKYGKYKLYGFADYGRLRNLDEGSEEAGTEYQGLASVGVGVDFNANNNWFAKVEVTQPIDEPDDIDENLRAFFQLGYRW